MPDYLPTLAETPEAAIIPGLDERKQRARIAAALLMQGSSGEPIKSWTQGLNRVAQGLIGGYQLGDVRRQGEAEEARTQAILSSLGMPGGAGTPSAAIPQRAAESDSPAPAAAAPAPPPQRIAALGPPPGGSPGAYVNQEFATAQKALGPGGAFTPGDPSVPRPEDLAPRTAALTSPTVPGAVPVQTQSIRPAPAQVAQAAPPGMASRADVIPPAIQAEIQLGRALAANRPTRDAGLAMYRAALEKAQAWQASQLPSVRDVDPDKPPMIYDPRTQSLRPVPGFGGGTNQVMGPEGKPITVDPSLNQKEARKAITEKTVESLLPATDKDASALRKEIRDIPSVKAMAEVGPRYSSMVSAAGRDNRAADLSLVYGLMKILDPTSVVRESEAAMAQQIATIPENFRAQVQSFLTGTGRLAPDVRSAIIQEARGAAESYKTQFDRDTEQYRQIAKDRRFKEEHIIPGFGTLPTFTPPPTVNSQQYQQAIDEAKKRGLLK